jgi:diaminopimelate epimerase
VKLTKSHAYGNDFLLVEDREVPRHVDRSVLARAACDRHRGLGADGLITFVLLDDHRARMALLNADGSYSEVSGNGVRCLAAALTRWSGGSVGHTVAIETDAGVKSLELLAADGVRFTFRGAMGAPENLQMARLDVNGTAVDVVTLRVGNPQCVVLGEVTEDRLHSVAAALAVHPHFPAGTNVELAQVEAPHRVRILIWERGVGPTTASGTGACAAAVAAIAFGGAAREVDVISPGGTQRVEWPGAELFLTGDAELIAECTWQQGLSANA